MKNSIDYTMADVTGYIGWNTTYQWELCRKAGITPIRGRKGDSKTQYGYTKDMFEQLLDAGGYTTVKKGKDSYLVHKSRLKEV